MRRVLNDDEQQREFIKKGYVRVPMLSTEEVNYVLDEMSRLRPDDGFNPDGTGIYKNTFHCSFLDLNVPFKREVHNLVQKVFVPYVEKYLAGYHIMNANFYVKPPHQGDFRVHQNWPIMEDLNDTSVTIWCPLQDTYRENGTLQVVEGSHKIVPHVEGPAAPEYFYDIRDVLFEKWLKPIDVKAGEGIIFDDGLIHWTARNDSDAPRIALQILCTPKETVPVYYYFDPEYPDRFEVIEVDPEFFITQSNNDIVQRDPNWKHRGYAPNRNRFVTAEEFEDLIQRGDELRQGLYVIP